MLPNFDIVAENYSLGVMEGFGLGYDVLKQACPGIIYATVKGFGTYGPYSYYLAFDPVAQAMGGAFSVNGQPGGPPLRPGLTFGDTGSGLSLAVGILAAYVEKHRTGVGQMVEVSMQEAMLNFARNVFSDREALPGGVCRAAATATWRRRTSTPARRAAKTTGCTSPSRRRACGTHSRSPSVSPSLRLTNALPR